MRIIIEFRKPSKRMMWNLKRLDRWLDKHLPPFFTALSAVLVVVGFFVMMGVVGSIEYGDVITKTHIRLLIGSVISMSAGVFLAAYIGGDDNYEEG